MYIKRSFFISFIVKFPPKPLNKKVQGCALRKIEGISLVLWISEIQGTQLVISMKKITFPNSPRAKVRCLQGPLRAYKTQPSALIQVKLQNMGSSLVSFAWCDQVNSVSWLSTVYQHPPTPVIFENKANETWIKTNWINSVTTVTHYLWKFKERITGPVGLIRSNHA